MKIFYLSAAVAAIWLGMAVALRFRPEDLRR